VAFSVLGPPGGLQILRSGRETTTIAKVINREQRAAVTAIGDPKKAAHANGMF
jgi:hypothetical protein